MFKMRHIIHPIGRADRDETETYLIRRAYRATRRAAWIKRMNTRKYLAFVLSVLLAPSWANGAHKEAYFAKVEQWKSANRAATKYADAKRTHQWALQDIVRARKFLQMEQEKLHQAEMALEVASKIHGLYCQSILVNDLIDN